MAFDTIEDLVIASTKRKLDGLPTMMVAYFPLTGFGGDGDDDDDFGGFEEDEGFVMDARRATAAAIAEEKTAM
jgi:hypothetical protein